MSKYRLVRNNGDWWCLTDDRNDIVHWFFTTLRPNQDDIDKVIDELQQKSLDIDNICDRCYGSGDDPNKGDGISDYCRECEGTGKKYVNKNPFPPLSY